ncbi:hypothetical protein SBBP1_110069 [Burkholderiales bacterium]|nr:hypothetical protein SBBP1_110069 [Burkholderiales bacterium]
MVLAFGFSRRAVPLFDWPATLPGGPLVKIARELPGTPRLANRIAGAGPGIQGREDREDIWRVISHSARLGP